jgi:hypothetical protein
MSCYKEIANLIPTIQSASLLIFSFCSYFVWKSYQDGDLTIGKLIVFFVIIIVCIGLWLASGQTLGSDCGVVG